MSSKKHPKAVIVRLYDLEALYVGGFLRCVSDNILPEAVLEELRVDYDVVDGDEYFAEPSTVKDSDFPETLDELYELNK